MRRSLRHLSIIAFFLAAPLCGQAATILQMDLRGTFTSVTGEVFLPFGVGDSFQFSITFDDTDTELINRSHITVNSILSSHLVARNLNPYVTNSKRLDIMDNQLQLMNKTNPEPTYLEVWVMMRPSQTPLRLSRPYEFSHFQLLDGIEFVTSDLIVGTSNAGYLHGTVTSISVTEVIPEPSSLVLLSLAGAGVFLRSRRSKAA